MLRVIQEVMLLKCCAYLLSGVVLSVSHIRSTAQAARHSHSQAGTQMSWTQSHTVAEEGGVVQEVMCSSTFQIGVVLSKDSFYHQDSQISSTSSKVKLAVRRRGRNAMPCRHKKKTYFIGFCCCCCLTGPNLRLSGRPTMGQHQPVKHQ